MAGGAVADVVNPFKTPLCPKHYYGPWALVTSLFFLWGFSYGLVDVLNKKFQETLHVTKLQSTGLQVAYFGVGYFAFSPVAAEVMRRKGYKFTILMGLVFYSVGAIMFWPLGHFSQISDNKAGIFGGFVAVTAFLACGLATLEVSANSYVSAMPDVQYGPFRLQLSQSFNGLASFVGPLIASKYFFTGEHSSNLNTVQWVYLAVAGMGVIVAVAFIFTKLPEPSEAALQEEAEALAEASGADEDQLAKPFWKQVRPIFGFVAQFLYVGAQVAIGSFFVNYLADEVGYSSSKASQFLSWCLLTFTVARFLCAAALSVFSPAFLLLINAVIATIFTAILASAKGQIGVASMFLVYFAMAIMYPVIFTTGTVNLGRHTRRAAGLLVQGVAGGAVFPPMQGAIAERYGTRKSFWINVPCFAVVTVYALYIWRQRGFTVLTSTEVARQAQLANGGFVPAQKTALDLEASSVDDKKAELEQVERI